MSINQTMYSQVKAFQASGYDVWIGRVGVSELIAVQEISIDKDNDLVTISVRSTTPVEYLYIAPDQLAVVQPRDR